MVSSDIVPPRLAIARGAEVTPTSHYRIWSRSTRRSGGFGAAGSQLRRNRPRQFEGGSIAAEKEGIAGDIAPFRTIGNRVARNGGVQADPARTGVRAAGVLVIAIVIDVALGDADADTAGADFVGAAVIIRTTIGQALPADANFLAVAIFIRQTLGETQPVDADRSGGAIGVTQALNAISVDAAFAGVALVIRTARIAAPVDARSRGRTVLVAIARVEHGYARPIDAGFIDIANQHRTRIVGITADCAERRKATQNDTNPKRTHDLAP